MPNTEKPLLNGSSPELGREGGKHKNELCIIPYATHVVIHAVKP